MNIVAYSPQIDKIYRIKKGQDYVYGKGENSITYQKQSTFWDVKMGQTKSRYGHFTICWDKRKYLCITRIKNTENRCTLVENGCYFYIKSESSN